MEKKQGITMDARTGKQINKPEARAQAALEYLLTYGWALVLIAAIVSMLVFIITSPVPNVVFSSSDPTKILLRGGSVSGSDAEIKLLNITGGKIKVTNIVITGGFSGASCTLNGQALPASSPVEVGAGGELFIECSGLTGDNGQITLEYTDYANLQRQVSIVAGAGTGEGSALVMHYSFDESSGTAVGDSSERENHGTLANFACTTLDCDPNSGWVSSGHSGNAISFDGVNDYVNMGTTLKGFNFGMGSFSFSFWMKPRDFSNDVQPRMLTMGWCTPGTGAWMYMAFTTKPAGVQTSNITYGSYPVWEGVSTDADSLTVDEWKHVVFVLDRDLNLGTSYVNGMQQADVESLSWTYDYNCEEISLSATVGGYVSSMPYSGQLDDWQIYRKALTEAEVMALYSSG